MTTLSKLDKYSPVVVGALQALGVMLYVILFATSVTQLGHVLPEPPELLGIAFFLLAFVFSAMICGGLILGYPILLAMRKEVARAFRIVWWSGITFAVILVITIIILLLT